MSKDLKTFRQELKTLEAMFREKLPDIAIVLTLSAKALAERNIKERGFGEQYSNLTVPAWFLKGKAGNNTGEKFIQSKIDNDEETNWKQLRAAEGKQTSFVDLTFTGRMLSNMQPGEVIVTETSVSAPLVATNREDQNKMNWNRDRYGDFIGRALTQQNKEQLFEVIKNEFLKIIRDSGISYE